MQGEIWTRMVTTLEYSLDNLQVTRPFKLLDRCLDFLRRAPSNRVASKHVL